jgi:Arc/MetJ family transcription regulator
MGVPPDHLPESRHNVADQMAVKRSSIRLDADLVDEAAKILAAKSRTEAVAVVLREIVTPKRFKELMQKQESEPR